MYREIYRVDTSYVHARLSRRTLPFTANQRASRERTVRLQRLDCTIVSNPKHPAQTTRCSVHVSPTNPFD